MGCFLEKLVNRLLSEKSFNTWGVKMIIEKLLGKHLNDINLSDYAHVLHTSSPNN